MEDMSLKAMDWEVESEVQSEVAPPRCDGVNFFLRFGSARPMVVSERCEVKKFGGKKLVGVGELRKPATILSRRLNARALIGRLDLAGCP
jgi:hypothetical protein